MVGPRADQAPVVVAVAVALRRCRLAVPERADHERVLLVAALERHQHLIADLREEVGAPVVTAHRHREPSPEAELLARLPGKAETKTRLALRVAIIGDGGECDPAQETVRLALRLVAVRVLPEPVHREGSWT